MQDTVRNVDCDRGAMLLQRLYVAAAGGRVSLNQETEGEYTTMTSQQQNVTPGPYYLALISRVKGTRRRALCLCVYRELGGPGYVRWYEIPVLRPGKTDLIVRSGGQVKLISKVQQTEGC